MNLALITDPKGFQVVEQFKFGYHLALAQHVLSEGRYQDFYREAAARGHFVMIDNGAAEDGTIPLEKLLEAADRVSASEIILPDALGEADKSYQLTTSKEVLEAIPAKRRAVVPQGSSLEEWFIAANALIENVEFATLCIPKHLERFPGGRAKVLKLAHKLGWHIDYHIHLLGIWGDPYKEICSMKEFFPWIRGIDTALPFALAQNKIALSTEDIGHVSHFWGKRFDRVFAIENINTLWSWIWSYNDGDTIRE